MKRDAEAHALLENRVKIGDQFLHNEPDMLCFVYDDLAIFYLVRGRFEDAQPLYKRAIELREKAFGSNDPRVAQGLELYQQLLHIGHHENESNALGAKAAAIRAQTAGSNR